MTFSSLVQVSKTACDKIAPLIRTLYGAMNSETSKLKADASVFTIADGIVQHLLSVHLFDPKKFRNVVGEEEDSKVNLNQRPYYVDRMKIPEEFYAEIDAVVADISRLGKTVDDKKFNDMTVFIDPIDGTREFASGLGEQCSVCIGFADSSGNVVAGLVYRPIPNPATYAGGCSSEKFAISELDIPEVSNPSGFLTTNGGISKFTEALIAELGFQRVRSGGAGNKMLMLLEGKGAAYIQDRGVSRWDTAAAQAVIEAHGGALSKLTSFSRDKTLTSYVYLKSHINLDFEPGVAALTPYNCAASVRVAPQAGAPPTPAASAEEVKPYANLCGLIALSRAGLDDRDRIFAAVQRAQAAAPPSYD
jgi:3'-phosphoadenosine 5'-phosphosulfate (PAPS) 3'-phosphatase